MDRLINLPPPKNCKKHNLPIIFYSSSQQKEEYCGICLQEKTGLISAEQQQIQWNSIFNQEYDNCNNDIQMFEEIQNTVLNYKQNIIIGLDKILQVINDQIKVIGQFKTQFQQLIQKLDDQEKVDNLVKESQSLQKHNQEVKRQVFQQLEDFQRNQFKIDEILSNFDLKQNILKEEKGFEYELIPEFCRKEKNWCNVFAFNSSGDILAVGYEKEIVVKQFVKGMIGMNQQKLTDHTQKVNCLCFMRFSNSFASGSADGSIILWEFDNLTKSWYSKTKLQEQRDEIFCLLISKDDNLLISGSKDGYIKFWSKKDQGWSCVGKDCYNTFDSVYGISLNEKKDKIISCLYNTGVLKSSVEIIQLNNFPERMQTIYFSSQIYSLCFTVGEQFIIQPHCAQLEVYDYDSNLKKFQKISEIQIQESSVSQLLINYIGYFQVQYIQLLKIIVVQYFEHLNIFKIQKDGNYKLIQTILSDHFKGTFTNDGQYYVTWCGKFRSIQVRKVKYTKQYIQNNTR